MAFAELYRRMNGRVSPDPLLKAEVLGAAEEAGRGKKKRRFRPAAAVAAMLACLIVTGVPVCVLAAENPGFNSMLYQVSPALAQFFKPVNLSCEDNGILLEVESAAVQGDSAQVYLTLRDLTGDRIDETVDLYDSAKIREAYDSVSNCRLTDYDPDTKTARFLLSTSTMDGREIRGNKITFSASCFLSKKKTYEDVEVPVDWEQLPKNASTIQAHSFGGGGRDTAEFEAATREETCTVLQPGKPLDWPVKEMSLTAIGFVDGKLHVQTVSENNLTKDNHGFFWLEDSAGKKMEENYRIYSYDPGIENPGDQARVDSVFQISQEELQNYTLHGEFTTAGLYTEGKWEVTFPLE